jgi:hypothetical protein
VGNEKPGRSPQVGHPEDYRRARILAASILLGLVSLGTVVNLYNADERFSPTALVAVLTAALCLLGVSLRTGS